MVSLQRQADGWLEAVDEAAVGPVGMAQPLPAAASAEIHLLLQERQPGQVTSRQSPFRAGARRRGGLRRSCWGGPFLAMGQRQGGEAARDHCQQEGDPSLPGTHRWGLLALWG